MLAIVRLISVVARGVVRLVKTVPAVPGFFGGVLCVIVVVVVSLVVVASFLVVVVLASVESVSGSNALHKTFRQGGDSPPPLWSMHALQD